MSKVYHATLLQLQRSGKARAAQDFAKLNEKHLLLERGVYSQRLAKASPLARAALLASPGFADHVRAEREAAEQAAEAEQVAVNAPLPTQPEPETRETDKARALGRLYLAAAEVK